MNNLLDSEGFLWGEEHNKLLIKYRVKQYFIKQN